MPNVPTYIREEDYTLYLEAKKNGWSEFIHAALNNLPVEMAYNPAKHTLRGEPVGNILDTTEPTYAPIESKPINKVRAQDTEAPKLKVMTNDDLKALLGSSGKQPIEAAPTHVCKDTCKHWVWDTDRGGRTNTFTGEFQEGEPW